MLTKQEKKELAVIRHQVHMMGELLTLKMIIDRMEVYGERICMVEKRKEEIIQHSVNDFRADVFALGTALLKHGFKGKHLGIIAENSYAWVVTFFAVTCGVGVVVPIDKELDDETISLLLKKADVEGVFFSKMYQKSAKYHMEHDETCPVGVCFNKEYPEENILNYDALVAEGKALVAEGDRIQKERAVTRAKSVNRVIELRYNDMFFRQVQDESLTRYSQAFDLAQKYVYMAAQVYDYETGLRQRLGAPGAPPGRGRRRGYPARPLRGEGRVRGLPADRPADGPGPVRNRAHARRHVRGGRKAGGAPGQNKTRRLCGQRVVRGRGASGGIRAAFVK